MGVYVNVFFILTDIQYRWVDASFPFTHPSFEMDIKIGDEWVEMLGCGVLRQEILDRCKLLVLI